MDNLQGLVVDVKITEVTGTSERDVALDMLQMVSGGGRITVGADRGYDTRDFVWDCRDMHITPHVAQRQHSAIDGRTTRHGGYRLSQRVRKRVEEVFGWVKTVGGGRKLRYLGVDRNQMWADLTEPDTTSSAWPDWHRARPEHGCESAGPIPIRDNLGHRTPSLVHDLKQPSSTPC